MPRRVARPVKAFLLVLLIGLAGCTTPPQAPADAVEARDDAAPGLVLRAWTEPTDGGLLLRGELVNGGDRPVDHRVECGHPWNSTISDADGRQVRPFVRDPCHDYFYQSLTPGAVLEFRQTWDLADHEPGEPEGEPVPAGNYTWDLEVGVVRPQAMLRTALDIVVPDETQRSH